MTTKIRILSAIIICVLLIGCLTGCASWNRSIKSIKSDFAGGIDRTITVYDYNGNVLGQWSGKIDMSESENEVFFEDANGKRVIIHGGIVISEEN